MGFYKGGSLRETWEEREALEAEKRWRRNHMIMDIKECPICDGSGLIETEADDDFEEEELGM